MDHRHAQHAAVLILAQMLDQAARMEIAEPHGDAVIVHRACDGAGIDAVELEGDGRHAGAVAVDRSADDAAVVARRQPGQQAVGQRILLRGDQIEGGLQQGAVVARRAVVAGQRGQVFKDAVGGIGGLIAGIAGLQLGRNLILAIEVMVQPVQFGQQVVFPVH